MASNSAYDEVLTPKQLAQQIDEKLENQVCLMQGCFKCLWILGIGARRNSAGCKEVERSGEWH